MVGSLTGDAMTTQSNCTLIGSYAGTLIDHNDANGTTLIGYNAGGSITQGQRNIAIGYESLDALAAGDQNVAIGHQALTAAANDEIGNICIGYLAGDSINHASADYNVFIGDQAGRGGLGAMIGCVGIGANALNSTTSNPQTGSVAIGHDALTAVTSGVHNVAVGYSAGSPVTTGSYSTAVGHESLGVSAANVITGNFNTCFGYRSGYDIEGASHSNTIVGANTGAALTTGVQNTIIGKSAGGSITTGGNNTIIGFDVNCASDQDAAIAIGRSFTSDADGNQFTVGNGTNYMKYDLDDGDITITSDIRLKENIIDSPIGLSFIEKLRPVQFNKKAPADLPEEFWNLSNLPEGSTERTSTEAGKKKITGLIAQEVKEVMDELEVDFNGWSEQEKTTKQELSYVSFIVPLIKSVQELSAKVEELEAKLK